MLRIQIAVFLSVIALTGCFKDDGVIDPGNPPKPVLGRFQGRAQNEGDTALSAKRLLNLTNPQVSLVWQFLGPKEYIITPSQGTVNTNPPYPFDIRLLEPPSPEVLDNPDLAIGGLWLYSDRNGNGKLDRLVHPDMLAATRTVDSLYGIYQAALSDLAATGEVKDKRVDVVETYHIGAFGTVTLGPPGDEDTLFVGHSPADTASWDAILNPRFHNLTYQNRWERFFTLRNRANDYYRIVRPSQNHIYEIDMPIRRKLFPKPGGQHEFERKMREVFRTYSAYVATAEKLLYAQIKQGHNEYPYSGFDEPGADWVAGRSRQCFVVYLRDQAELQELRDAEQTSSFTMKGMDKMRTGYNAVRCDDQYNCEFMDPGAELTLDLGQSDGYFNPPAGPPPLRPITVYKPAEVKAPSLDRLAGSYAFQPFFPIRIAAKGGYLWAQIPDEGILRLTPADSLHYFATARDLQVQFVENDSLRVYKLFLFKDNKKYVAARDGAQDDGDLAGGLDSLLGPGIPMDAARAALFTASPYAYGKDTVAARWSGDSLHVTVPGMLPMALAASDSVSFFSRESDLRAAFEIDPAGKCAGVWLTRAGKRIMAPALAYVPPSPADLFPGLADSLPVVASEHAGSGSDRSVIMDGGPRFAPGPDSLFLRPGDGWIDALVSADASDSISLRQGGDYLLFRVPDLAGKGMAIELTLCPQRGVRGRVRLSLRGGADKHRQDDYLGGDLWVDFSDGKPKSVRLGPWKAGANPYYVRIGQIATADPSFLYSFDHYRVLTE